MAAIKQDAFVAAAEKAVRGDAAGAIAAVASVVTSMATGQPLLGVVAGRGAEVFAQGVLDSATDRLKAAEKEWDNEAEKIAAIERILSAAIAPLDQKLEELTQLSKEQFLQTLRYVERRAQADAESLQWVKATIQSVSEFRAREGTDWVTLYKGLLREAERWLKEAENSANHPGAKRAARLIYHGGICVRTSRVLDDRFRLILEQVNMFARDPDGRLGSEIYSAVLGVAHQEIMVSSLERSVGALSVIAETDRNPSAFGGILDCCRRLLSMLGNTGMTPFAVKQDLEGVLNGLEYADDDESVKNWVAHCEACFTVMDRGVLRRAESLLGALSEELTAEHELPTPGWIFKPFDVVTSQRA